MALNVWACASGVQAIMTSGSAAAMVRGMLQSEGKENLNSERFGGMNSSIFA
jgi:hypothetical protein